MVNDIGLWGGHVIAEGAKEILLNDPTHYTKLGRIGNVVQGMKVGCEIVKTMKQFRKTLYEGRYDSAFEWLADIVTCIWLVRMVEDNVVDHCVAINADEKIILDSEEKHPLRLTSASLKFCGGPRSDRLRFAEIFQLTKAN